MFLAKFLNIFCDTFANKHVLISDATTDSALDKPYNKNAKDDARKNSGDVNFIPIDTPVFDAVTTESIAFCNINGTLTLINLPKNINTILNKNNPFFSGITNFINRFVLSSNSGTNLDFNFSNLLF